MNTFRSGRATRGPFMLTVLAALALAGCADEPTVQQPVLITDAPPFRYPVALWDEGVEGETVMMVHVTDMGGVDSVYILETSGHAAFDSAAADGARELRFAPGRRDDRRVAMWARLPVRFHLNDLEVEATPEAATADRP